ncbi:NAD(P)/FAD-dependent oxidoreductase [Sphingobacterium alkalisoli]|uniref:NADH:ubiquinone reductase (non-electrogenic) n=3 Tax=Sphingobacteriaceae TaxID=84566 RepID=A0A4U0NGA9_9SPHI|nr:NAD(P)/FAD-dependent oxidoreductase [Sphingobacterium alkalisoli]TJZ53196.1 NAD(P)/FAD-dependent oxidoreductase [Sphingobacterium olei]
MGENIKHIVVVGGGFAGINFIKSICDDKRYHITLVDINNYNFFPPLIYQVATAFIEPSNISMPFRRMFYKNNNVYFHLGTLKQIDSDSRKIITDNGSLSYDYLVLAVGTESNYFGLENVKDNAYPMKTVSEALGIRNKLLLNMEEFIRYQGTPEGEGYLNIVIAGGGPSGVEIAGMVAELGQRIIKKEYPEIKDFSAHIYLVDAAKTLLGPMSSLAQEEAKRVLEKLGVKVILDVAVKDYVDEHVILSNDVRIKTKTLIWTSGVTGRELPGLPTTVITRGRRVLVNEYNAVQGFDNIFALGDICYQTSDPNYPNGHPQLAQVAIQQGILLAKNLKSRDAKDTLKPFSYVNKGSMAVISRYNAVADLPSFSFKGFFAWLTWLIIHLFPIAGFRNKWKLLGNWMYAFFSTNSTLRLIIKGVTKKV